MTEPALPPGPHYWLPGRFYLAMMRDFLGFLQGLARDWGDIVHSGYRTHHLVLLNHPDHVQEVLVTHQKNFHKTDSRLKEILGQGLLTSEGDFHLRQRRRMQPAFHRDQIAAFAAVMVEQALELRQSWQPGETVDLSRAMMRLTQVMVAQCLFRTDVQAEANQVTDALTDILQAGRIVFRLPFRRLLEQLHLPAFRRFRDARDRLDAVVYQIIARRRQESQGHNDLLSTLMAMHDSEGGMSDQQLRDEMLTLFLAGHETTANALSWAWYLLAQHPEIEVRLHEEIDTVLAGRAPEAGDEPRLTYTDAIFREALRLYPPIPLITRRALESFSVGGYQLPAGTLVMMSPYLIQRDPRFFTEPERFQPERWTPELKRSLPHFAYFPFGGGSRQCIGESFAWMEGTLVLATLGQKWRLRLAANHPPVVPKLAVTLRPRPAIRMTLEPRR